MKKSPQDEYKNILCYYLSHEFEESCQDSDGATRLFGVSERTHFAAPQNRGPFIQRPFQQLALFLKGSIVSY